MRVIKSEWHQVEKRYGLDIDADLLSEIYPELDEDVVSVPEAQAYAMLYTYPNPFTDKNNVEFELTTDAEVTLSMYNTDGKLVREMYQGEAKADQKYKFEFDAENLPTGVYIYKLITPTEIFVERVVLTR